MEKNMEITIVGYIVVSIFFSLIPTHPNIKPYLNPNQAL